MKCPKRRTWLKLCSLSYVYDSASGSACASLGFRQRLLRVVSPRCSWPWVLHGFITRLHVKGSFHLFGFLPFPSLHFFSFTFYFTQISFFASLLPRLLHQAGCPTSLSSASVCSPADPGFFLAPTHLRARHRLLSIVQKQFAQCKINTVRYSCLLFFYSLFIDIFVSTLNKTTLLLRASQGTFLFYFVFCLVLFFGFFWHYMPSRIFKVVVPLTAFWNAAHTRAPLSCGFRVLEWGRVTTALGCVMVLTCGLGSEPP